MNCAVYWNQDVMRTLRRGHLVATKWMSHGVGTWRCACAFVAVFSVQEKDRSRLRRWDGSNGWIPLLITFSNLPVLLPVTCTLNYFSLCSDTVADAGFSLSQSSVFPANCQSSIAPYSSFILSIFEVPLKPNTAPLLKLTR